VTADRAVVSDFVDLPVGKVQVLRGGSGQPVVYLHSATGEGLGLPLIDAMVESYDVIAPMFPGFGESEGIEEVDDMEDAVFVLLDLFEALSIEAPVVVGQSLGGWMAAELTSRYPRRVGALVLVNPVGLHLDGAPIKDIFSRSPGDMAEDLFADQSHPMAQLMHALDDYRNDPAQIGNLTFDMVKPVIKHMGATARLGWDPYLHNPKLRKRLRRIDVPTLVVRGVQDTLVPEAHARTFAEEIPGAQYAELADAAHLATVERGPELATLIREFLDA